MIKYQMLISTIKVRIMNQNILSGKKNQQFHDYKRIPKS